MRIIYLIGIVLTCTIFVSLYAGYRDGDLTISQFKVRSDSYAQMSNYVIKNESSDTLLSIDTIPLLRPGQLIMREKKGNEYAMFFGKLGISI